MHRGLSQTLARPIRLAIGASPLGLLFLGLTPGNMAPWETPKLGLAHPAQAQTRDAAASQSRDPVVTSDTPEYCGVLMDLIAGMTRSTATPPPTEAAVLSEEGERMCVHGQIRGGILRLRRALVIMRHGERE